MIIYGKNIIKEAINAKRPIYKIYIDAKMTDKAFLNHLKNHNLTYEMLNKHQLNEKAQSIQHQGVVAEVQDYTYKNLVDYLSTDKKQKFLILDEIHDPHNLGAILRSVEAANFDGVIIGKKHQVLLNGTVAKTSSGALEYVNIFLVNNLHHTILQLQKYAIKVIGTDMKAELVFKEIPQNESFAIILGNEGIGVRLLLKKNCDYLVRIPMSGKINSLNVSVAAAVIMFGLQMK
ncbi:MAG: 23S rRNA (guanosine(2251)-2'-O)-methyltransferase RlmB [Candidatus Phytoplasma pruni]|uniref:23S rRNA (guanosine(2251)-2'-O)-methyltransferase RlmB n=1 Tax=16SrIII (X-disease group) TaxID=85623 RepID=UPI0003648F9E|nr:MULTISPECIES: 23S rRNA (guanosine(2251)-2'-O)-methyltransferase RlmB [16SrIII (X-disease group)]